MDERSYIIKAWLLDGESCEDIGEALGRSKSSIHREITSMGLAGEKGNVQLYRDLTVENADALLNPVRLEVPKLKKPKTDSCDYVSVHWGDVQFPFQDDAALSILYQITQDANPTHLWCMGDIADMWQISDYLPILEKGLAPDQIDIQSTIEMTSEHLAIMRECAPEATEAYYLEGNHEERFERLLAKLQTNHRMAGLMRLPKLSEALTMPYLLGTSELGYEYIRYKDQPIVMNDKLALLHGDKATKYITRNAIERFGMSAMMGHTHKTQTYYRRTLKDTLKGYSIGCLCDLKQPYVTFAEDWTQGFAVVTWKRVGDEFLFNVEQVEIENERAFWRDKLYKG